MFIQTEDTPNPATLKFSPGCPVMQQGTAAFSASDDHSNSPLAQSLFTISAVTGVFFGSDFITVTKNDKINWDLLKPEILSVIMDHFVSGSEVILAPQKSSAAKNQVQDDDSDIVKKIKELIEDRVRPAVAMDGGDIIFHKYEDSIVYLEMHGSCAGCPSSGVTLKSGIESMLKHFIPEIKEVVSIEE